MRGRPEVPFYRGGAPRGSDTPRRASTSPRIPITRPTTETLIRFLAEAAERDEPGRGTGPHGRLREGGMGYTDHNRRIFLRR